MDLSKEWYWSEFVNQEMLEQHRVIETEYTFYDAIANGNIEYVQDNCINQTFTNPDGMGKTVRPTNFRISAITLLSRLP